MDVSAQEIAPALLDLLRLRAYVPPVAERAAEQLPPR